jgi:hypothetical protein
MIVFAKSESRIAFLKVENAFIGEQYEQKVFAFTDGPPASLPQAGCPLGDPGPQAVLASLL